MLCPYLQGTHFPNSQNPQGSPPLLVRSQGLSLGPHQT